MRWSVLLLVLALAVSACQDEQAEREALARLAPLESSTGPATATPSASPSALGTANPSDTAASRCTNERAAYTVSYPEDWVTNTASGSDPAPCTLFDPQSVTDEAAITLAVESTAFATASAGQGLGRVRSLAVGAVGGMAAVRLRTVTADAGSLPAGTRRTTWVIDLQDVLGGDTVLTAATDETGPGEYGQLQGVLDDMMASLVFTTTPTSDVVLRVAGPEAFQVTAHRREGRRVCLGLAIGQRIFTDCTFRAEPAGQLSVAVLAPVAPIAVTAGTTTENVARVDLELGSGRVVSSVPRAIPEGGYAWAAPVDVDRVREVRAVGRAGRVMGRAQP